MPRTVVTISDLLLAADVEPDDGSRAIDRSCRALAVAPTILHLLGQPVPEDMDGHVLDELLDDGFKQRQPAKREAEAR